MTDQTPSGNRWEPTTPSEPDTEPTPTVDGAAPTSPPPAVAERPGRWRALHRPGRHGLVAAGAALVVLVGVGGFLTGRASVDVPAPAEVGQQWRHGDSDLDGGDGRELPGRPFDGAPGTDPESTAPDAVPGTNS